MSARLCLVDLLPFSTAAIVRSCSWRSCTNICVDVCMFCPAPRHDSHASCLQLPSSEECEALLLDRQLTSIVFFLDGTFEELTYDVTTTVLEAVEQLAGIIKLQNYTTFTLYECKKVSNDVQEGKVWPWPGSMHHAKL